MTTLRKTVLGVVILLVLAWLLSAGLLYARQDQVLYTGAGQEYNGITPDEAVVRDVQNKPWGWVGEPLLAPRATVLFFHGAETTAAERWDFYRHYFTRRGLRVVFAEYPGYGERVGVTPTFDTVVPDAIALAKKVQEQYPDSPLWIAGESVGAAVAAQVGAVTEVAQVILTTPWHRFDAVVAQDYAWLPTKWLIKQEYDSCQALSAKKDKVRILYAEFDEVIPARHAKSLATCLKLSTTQTMEMPRSGHNDWAVRMDADQLSWLLDYSSQ